jgi:putative FmdB family regulatory protein
MIYDYICKDCSKTYEKIVRNCDDVQVCPECQKTMDRQIGSPTLSFVGKDWTPKHYPN